MVVQVVLQRRWGAQWLAIKSWQWPTKINANYSTVIQHLKGEKAWYMWVYHELTTYQKNCFKVSSSLILCNNNEPFFDWTVTWDKILYNFIWQPAMTSSAAGLRRALKHFPKPNYIKNRSWSLFGGLLPIWPTTALWIPAKPSHLRSMLSKLMSCTENCNARSQH